MKPDDNNNITPPAEDEIDLIDLAKTLWNGRKTIIWSLAFVTFLGVFVALFSPVEYTAKTIMVPQIQSKTSGLGGLSSLAAMAGFNLDALQSGSSDLSPMVYPQIVQSIPFQKTIMHTPLNWKDQLKTYSLLGYDSISKPNPLGLIKKYTIGLPGVIFKWLNGSQDEQIISVPSVDSLKSLSKQEKDMLKMLKKRLTLEVNSKEGYITLTAIAPEAIAAAQIAQKAQELLQEKVTEIKIDKAKQNLAFVQSLVNEKETEFAKCQSRLAIFHDRNQSLGSAMAKTEEEKLQSEYQLAFSVFSEVAKQLETAKIKVKEDTPIFSIIEPVSIPTEKSKPKKSIIVAIWFFIGGVIGVGGVFGKLYLKEFRKKWAIRGNSDTII